MKIAVAGSIARDHIMTFPGKFSDSLVADSLSKVSLSFLVDGLEIRRGGNAANIAFGMGALGLSPILVVAVGKDWDDYRAWLARHGVNVDHVYQANHLYTASFMVTTDQDLNQIASFFPGAMSASREIELAPIMEKTGRFDLMIVSPDDPEGMLRHTKSLRQSGVPFAADPSQQLARMSGEEIKQLITGAKFLFVNEYELALTMQKTGWSDQELYDQVEVRITTLGAEGCRIEEHGKPDIFVGVPVEKEKIDPTGVGDCFRAGFLAGLSWNLNYERSAQIGSLLATYCIETMGTQEYRFTTEEFLGRFANAYGENATNEIKDLVNSRIGL
jgi:adenosine kinase